MRLGAISKLLLALGLCLLCGSAFPVGNKTMRTIPYVYVPPVPFSCDVVVPDDGCSGAPAPTTAAFFQPTGFQLGGYINQYSGTPSNYMNTNCGPASNLLCRPTYMVAGFDYAIGTYNSGTPLQDPAVVPITGCTYSATGSTGGGPSLSCSGAWTGMSNFELGPIGLHGCTALAITAPNTVGQVAVMNNIHFLNDTGLCSIGQAAIVMGSLNWGHVDLNNSLYDGQSSVFNRQFGGCAPPTTCNPSFFVTGGAASALHLKYTVVKDFAGASLNIPSMNFQYSLVLGGTPVRGPNGHSEQYDGPSSNGIATSPTVLWDHAAWIQSKYADNFGPAPHWIVSAWPVAFTSYAEHYTVGINSWTGGMTVKSANVTGCIGATFISGGSSPSCGAGSGSSNTYYFASSAAPNLPGWGTQISSGCGSGGVLGPPVALTGTEISNGATGKWVLDGYGTGSVAQYGDLGEWTQTATVCNQTFYAQSSSNSHDVSSHGAFPMGQASFDNNFYDISSGTNPPSQPILLDIGGNPPFDSIAGTITTPGTSGGASSLSFTSPASVSLVAGENIAAAGIAGCTATTSLGCPTVQTSGTYTAGGAAVPLSLSSTNLSSTFNVYQAATCTNPYEASGNIDIAGEYSSPTGTAYFNQPTAIYPYNNCLPNGTFVPPTTTPFVSANFNPNQVVNITSNALTPAAGVTEFPTNPTNSAAFYFEIEVNPSLSYGYGFESPFSNMLLSINSSAGQSNPGQPNFFFNRVWNGSQPGSYWWLNPGATYQTGATANAGAGGYQDGFYELTAPSLGCIRSPAGVWLGNTGTFQQTDPGLGCPTGTLSLNAAAIAANVPNSGAQQTVTSASCASGGAGILVTASVPVSPGISPALQYVVNLTGTGGTLPSPATLTATSVTGSGPYTVVGTIAGYTCPTGLAGTINSGAGGTISFPAVSTTNPYQYGSTGIATHNGQHICGWIVENGSNSSFPGSQAIEMVDDKGNPLTGSPALVPYLNQGNSSFAGVTNGTTAFVTATPTTWPISTGATFDSSGLAHFSFAANPGFVPGTEFSVTGITTTGGGTFNLSAYIVTTISGAGPYLVTANPLSGPAGVPQASALTTSSSGTTGGTATSVIVPGETINALSIYAVIMPYGTNGATGTGGPGVATYALSGVPAANTSTMQAYGAFYYSAPTTPRSQATLGDFISELGFDFGGSMGNFATLWGNIPTQAGGAPSTSDLASICTKQTDIAAYAAAKGITVHSLHRLNDPGIFGDSSIADFTGSIAATGLTVVSGALPIVTAGVPSITISGAGITGCPASCPTISSGSGSSYILSASGGTVASEPMKAGTFKPAVPNAASTFKGYIDTTSGISTLHVTSFDNGTTHAGFGSFTGALNPSTNVLTATGTIVGSIPAPSVVSDGNVNITGQPVLINQFTGGGPPYTYSVGYSYYPTIAAEPMWATSSTIIPGEYILNSTALPAIVNPVKIVPNSTSQAGWTACGISGAYPGLLGCYTLSGSPNSTNAVGSLGSQVVFTGTTITDGGAIAPGPALTLNHLGPGTVFPVNFGSNTGTLTLSGTYNTTALGGTPSGIQVLVSNSANGPPLTGCTPCNWGALTGTISGGVWKGTIASIPGGAPYFVSVRPTNAIAYQTPSQSIRVGAAYATWGNGQVEGVFTPGGATSYFSGLWGYAQTGSAFGIGNDPYVMGPPIIGDFVPGQASNTAGDRFGVAPNGVPYPEPSIDFDQGITNGLNVPTSIFYAARDGVGMDIFALGNVPQTQTIGVGDGTSTVWCSSATFCTEPTGGVQTPLIFNAASLTGVWLNGSVSGSTLTVTTRYGGALEPNMVLGATGSPTVLRCLTSCTTPLSIDGSTWLLSSTSASGATGTLTSPLRADPPTALIPFGGTTTPWPDLNVQPSLPSNFGGFGMSVVKAGTAKFTDGTNSCTDTTAFAYNLTGGLCTGVTGVSAWENYVTGDYRVAFTTPPVAGAPIVATWTNIISPNSGTLRPQNIDEMGDGTSQTGFVSARFAKFPGGVSGQIWSSQGTDKRYMFNTSSPFHAGYPFGAPGYSEMNSWLFNTKFPALVPGYSASTPFLTTPVFRLERPATFNTDLADDAGTSQIAQDMATKSTFSGTVSGGVLTETTNAVGAIPWEGMVIDCVTVATACPLYQQSGVYITGLTGGTWGAAGSTYSLANAGTTVVSPAAPMQNAVYYSGAGPTLYLGALNDTQSYDGTHPGGGFAGLGRATRRWAAMIYGANGGAVSDPKVDRVKADDLGCDAAALAAPCFYVGTGISYNASFSTATWSPTGNVVTITGGLAAHARPFVVGMNTFCSSCNSNLIITSVSAPPTQSSVSGQGQVGNTFTFTVANVSGQPIGGSGSGVFAGGAAGTSGVGSNAIDIPISMTAGTALDTCGSNQLNGTASGVKAIPNGKCQGGQIGDIVRGFRIGIAQQANGDGNTAPAVGSVFDDGFDPAAGNFSQSSAFTCNIVAAKLVQCIKGPLYTAGVFAGVGEWLTGSTYIAYGDSIVVASRYGTLLGYVGGQSFPFTPGSGYTPTNGTVQPAVTCSGGGSAPIFDVTMVGGAIANVRPSGTGSAFGLNLVSTCTVALPAGGSGGAIPTITLGPVEGVGGIGTYPTDNNTMGTFLYDNSCLSTLSKFFTTPTGVCLEPGLPLRPFGQEQEEGVSG